MPRYEAPSWDGVRRLERRLKEGRPIKLTDSALAILRRAAQDVAIDPAEAEAALKTERRATALLRKIATRIHRGSNRLMDAVLRMYRLRDAGDLEGARREMRQVLAVLVVPHHRWIAQGQLAQLDDWSPPKVKPSKKMSGKGTQPEATKPRRPTPRRNKAGKAPPSKTPRRKITRSKPR